MTKLHELVNLFYFIRLINPDLINTWTIIIVESENNLILAI